MGKLKKAKKGKKGKKSKKDRDGDRKRKRDEGADVDPRVEAEREVEEEKTAVATGAVVTSSSPASASASGSASTADAHEFKDGKLNKKKRRRLTFQVLTNQMPESYLKPQDLRAMVLGLLTHRPNVRWLNLPLDPGAKNIVMILLEGLSFDQYRSLGPRQLPFIFANFQMVHSRTPGSHNRLFDTSSALLDSVLSQGDRHALEKELAEPTAHTYRKLCLTQAGLQANEFPTKSSIVKAEGWRNFNDELGPVPANDNGVALGIDCEMVKSELGPELARLSVVNGEGLTVLDMLVKPPREIKDYVTQYSGITEETLRNVTHTLADAQAALFNLMTASTILVGHSLENDLFALRVYYTRVIDTSVLYPRGRATGQKHALKHLARIHLNVSIQDSLRGHDSSEDARAAVQLAKLKVERGPRFGQDQRIDTELLFDTLGRSGITTHVVENNKVLASISMNGTGRLMQQHEVQTDSEAAEQLGTLLPQLPDIEARHFVWSRFRSPRQALHSRPAQAGGASSASGNNDSDDDDEDGDDAPGLSAPVPPTEAEAAQASADAKKAIAEHAAEAHALALRETDERVKLLFQSSGPGTMFVITTCAPDSEAKLMIRRRREQIGRGNWNDSDEEQLKQVVQQARDSVSLFGYKS